MLCAHTDVSGVVNLVVVQMPVYIRPVPGKLRWVHWYVR